MKARTKPAVQPILGNLAKTATRLPVQGTKRRKLLILLAAYADAGEYRPNLRMLGERLPFLDWTPNNANHQSQRQLEHLLKALERDGWIEMGSRTSAGRRKKRGPFIRLRFGQQQNEASTKASRKT